MYRRSILIASSLLPLMTACASVDTQQTTTINAVVETVDPVTRQILLRGDRAALGLTCFIATYWTARILVDAFYFSSDDWPKGSLFVIGHILLTSLFVALACSYWGLFVWNVSLRANS